MSDRAFHAWLFVLLGCYPLWLTLSMLVYFRCCS